MTSIINQAFIDRTTCTCVTAVTTVVNLTPAQSGTTFIVTKIAGVNTILNVNLPSPTIPGLQYTFIQGNAATANAIVDIGIAASGDAIGQWVSNAGAIVSGAGDSQLQFTATAVQGDIMVCRSTGVNWHFFATSSNVNGFLWVA